MGGYVKSCLSSNPPLICCTLALSTCTFLLLIGGIYISVYHVRNNLVFSYFVNYSFGMWKISSKYCPVHAGDQRIFHRKITTILLNMLFWVQVNVLFILILWTLFAYRDSFHQRKICDGKIKHDLVNIHIL